MAANAAPTRKDRVRFLVLPLGHTRKGPNTNPDTPARAPE